MNQISQAIERMQSLLPPGFGFENPLGLAIAAAILPLILLYLRLRRRPPAIVSSLTVWRLIPEAVVARRRPKLPLLFFVQMGLLLALASALARPFTSRQAPPEELKDVAMVLDLSASMQTREHGSTRFSEARSAAIEATYNLASESPGRTITVVAAALQPRMLGAGLTPAKAAELLARLEPIDAASNLAAAIETAAVQVAPSGAVHVFSDADEPSLVLSHDARAALQLHRFGESDDNVGITGLEVQENPFEDPLRARVLVTVKNFSTSSRRVAVTLRPLRDTAAARVVAARIAGGDVRSGAAGALAESGGGVASGVLAAGRRELVLGPLEAGVASLIGLAAGGSFAAELSPGDAFSLDDRVLGYLPPRRPLSIQLVTDDRSVERELTELAARIGNISLSTSSPAAFQQLTSRSGASAEISAPSAPDLILFDRYVPPFPPAANAAYIAPTRGNGDVTVAGPIGALRSAEIREHDLLRGLQNADTLYSGRQASAGSGLVGLSSAGPLKPVLIARADGREVGLVLAGTIGERRVVATAFRIGATDLVDEDALPSLVFTLNLIRWLAPAASDAPLQHLVGESLKARLPDASPITRLDGPGGVRMLSPIDEISLERAGVYRASGPGTARTLLVSFIDPVESAVGRPPIASNQDLSGQASSKHARSPGAATGVGNGSATESSQRSVATTRTLRDSRTVIAILAVAGLMVVEWLVLGLSREVAHG